MVRPYQLMIVPAAMMVGGGILATACGPSPGQRQAVFVEVAYTNRPNSPEYRGGSLEGFLYFTLADEKADWNGVDELHGPTDIVGVLRSGPTGGFVKFPLSVKPDGTDPVPPTVGTWKKQIQMFTVTDMNGVNLCQVLTDAGPKNIGYPPPHSEDEKKPANQAQYAGRAMAVPGFWDEYGDYRDAFNGKKVFTLSCMSAASAKCEHWGYLPWLTSGTELPGDPNLRDYYVACVLASRAEYEGGIEGHHPKPDQDKDKDTRAFTCSNTLMEIDDTRLGLQTFDKWNQKSRLLGSKEEDCRTTFESNWGSKGLLCATRARYDACDYEIGAPSCTSGIAHWSKPTAQCTEKDLDVGGERVLFHVKSCKHDNCPIHACPPEPGSPYLLDVK